MTDTSLEHRIRDLRAGDLDRVVEIDAQHTGQTKLAYWTTVFDDFLVPAARDTRVGLGAEADGVLCGYLLGEVRAFEFGSEECGWVFAVGVDPDRLREHVAMALLEAAIHRFREAGVRHVRTMVRKSDVPVLSFFRANGFTMGPFMQLEREA